MPQGGGKYAPGVVMGNRFEITIDYRFTIGKAKPTSYRLYNRFHMPIILCDQSRTK